MSSIVKQLQEEACNTNTKLLDLLRKALLIANKLKLIEFEQWVKQELSGYTDKKLIREYRIANCEIKANVPGQGWQTLYFPNRKDELMVKRVPIMQSISELQELRGTSKELIMPLRGVELQILQNTFKTNSEITRFIPNTAIDKICEAVKTTILEWALQLESEGILGEGISFTVQERNIASNNLSIQIEHFHGILGNIDNSIVTQELKLDIKKNSFSDLENALKNYGFDNVDIQDLIEAIKSDPQPTQTNMFGEKINSWIGKILTKITTGILNLPVEIVSSVAVNAILKFYGF